MSIASTPPLYAPNGHVILSWFVASQYYDGNLWFYDLSIDETSKQHSFPASLLKIGPSRTYAMVIIFRWCEIYCRSFLSMYITIENNGWWASQVFFICICIFFLEFVFCISLLGITPSGIQLPPLESLIDRNIPSIPGAEPSLYLDDETLDVLSELQNLDEDYAKVNMVLLMFLICCLDLFPGNVFAMIFPFCLNIIGFTGPIWRDANLRWSSMPVLGLLYVFIQNLVDVFACTGFTPRTRKECSTETRRYVSSSLSYDHPNVFLLFGLWSRSLSVSRCIVESLISLFSSCSFFPPWCYCVFWYLCILSILFRSCFPFRNSGDGTSYWVWKISERASSSLFLILLISDFLFISLENCFLTLMPIQKKKKNLFFFFPFDKF